MSTTPEEQLETLPVNHPQAGYLNHDRSGLQATGTVPAEEQAIYDERTAADEAEADAVAQNEHDVATADDEETPPATRAKSSTSSSSSSSSSSSKDKDS